MVIFNKLKEKFQSGKKSKVEIDDDSTEVTGKYDLEELEEEMEAPKSGLEKFVHSQLPFLAKFLPKKKPVLVDDDHEIDEEELHAEYEEELSHEEEVGTDSKLMEGLKKQLPFVYNLIKQVQQKTKKTNKPQKEKPVAQEGAKQKKVKPIHIVIGIGILYLFYTELFETQEVVDPVVEETPVPAPVPEPELPTEEPTPSFDTPPLEEEPMTPPAPEAPEEIVTPPVETIEEEDPEDYVPEEEIPAEEPTWEDITPPAVEDEQTTTTEEFNFDLEEETSSGEQTAETPLLENDEIEEQDITTSILRNLEDKVKERKEVAPTEVLEPTEAPDYEYKGRALVYNCQGGHWACVDDESFKSCRKNYAWNSSQGLEKECYAAEVYASEEDCARAQTINIDSVTKTDFCN